MMRWPGRFPMLRAFFLAGLALLVAGLACNVDYSRSAEDPPEQEEPAAEEADQQDVVPGDSGPEEPAIGGEPYSDEFLEADCSCAGYEASQVQPWGNSSLSCRYEWSGPNIDRNALGFEVVNYVNHEDELGPAFQQDVEDLSFSAGNQGDDWQTEELRNDGESYVFLSYGPGGGGKQGEIPLCGNGRGVFLHAGQFLISTELFACDLPYSEGAYANALADMETCARRAIERIK